MSAPYAIGIDLGGTNIKAARVVAGRGLVSTLRVETGASRGPDHVLDQVESVIRSLMDEGPSGALLGIGIGAPGTINLEQTELIHPPNIPGWDRIDLGQLLQSRFGRGLQVVVENDANAAALGSAHYGAGRSCDTFLMVTLGTGVGGAIIVNGKLFRGTTGAAGEIGHMTIDYNGPMDGSMIPGSIEAYVGQRFLCEHARSLLHDYTDSMLYGLAGSDLGRLTPEMLSMAAGSGDAGARFVLHWAGEKLGAVLGSCINFLDIRTVIVGGGVSRAGAFILEPAREAAQRYIKQGMHEGVKIIQETLGNEAGMLGAAHLVFEHAESHGTTFRGR